MAFTIDPVPQATAEGVLALATVKAQLSIRDDDSWDDLLAIYRDAAVEQVESYTGLLLRETAGLTWRGDFPPCSAPITLGRGPLISVEQIAYVDGAGDEVELADEDFAPQLSGSRIAALSPWPCGIQGRSVVIEFTAGYMAGEVPTSLLLAAAQAAAFWFENREATGGDADMGLPPGARALCDRFRPLVL